MFVSLALSALAAACSDEAARTELKADVGGAGPGGSGVAVSSSANASSSSGTGAGGMGGAGGAGAGGTEPWAGPVEHLAVLELGELPIDEAHGFPVPDRALGLTALVTAPDPAAVVGLRRLRPPVGGSVIYDFAMTDHDAQVFVGVGWIGGASPQSDAQNAVPVQEGEWTISLGDDDESVALADVRVWVRRTEDGVFHGGAVDVNVFTAPGVAETAYVDQVLTAMFAGGYAGLSLGQVAHHALDGAFTVLETHDEYRQMLQTQSAAAASSPAVNLFVVADIGDDDFGGAIGIAGGVPGSAADNGTNRSGVAYQPSGNVGYDATVLAHEIGHLGGLFHTTEFKIDETDPLSDTATCPQATIQQDPAACPDDGNTMFPIAYGGTSLSPAQQRVLQGSALYRGILFDGGQPAPAIAAEEAGPAARWDGQWPTLAATDDAPRRRPSNALERMLAGVWCGRADHIGRAIAMAARAPGGPLAPLRALTTEVRETQRNSAPMPAGSTTEVRETADPMRAGSTTEVRETADVGGLVRARALRAWVRAARDAGPEALASALSFATVAAGDPNEPRRVRAAGIRVLGEYGGRSGRVAAGRLRAMVGDPVIAALAGAL
jgi:hypothetical protein